MIQETIKFRISRHLNVKFVLMMKIRERVMLYNVGIVLVLFVGQLTLQRKSKKRGKVVKYNVYSTNVMLSSMRKRSNSSWTLKVDLVCEHLCRMLAHMDAHGYDTVTPVLEDDTIERRPLLDFQAGYVKRAIDEFPTQGSHGPWTVEMSYNADRARLRSGPVEDPALRFAAA